jgi:Phytochelatin synthase
MKVFNRLSVTFFLNLLFCASTYAETLQLPANLIGLGTPKGEQLLFSSTAHQAFMPLSMQFVTQNDQSYCGIATMVMVLNALNIPAPLTPSIEPFATFTQDNVLNEKTEHILPKSTLLEEGMTLYQLSEMLKTFGLNIEIKYTKATSIDEFVALANEYLGTPKHHVVVNYLRSSLGQESGGHISPLAAYDKNTDRFLILDVSRYKYPPVWVKAADLYAAMNTVDASSSKNRGFLLIK